MKKIVNGLLSFFKYIFLLLSFGLTLFIILKMYTRLNKSLTSAVVIFIPYFILLVLFLINSFLKREGVIKNLFYNMTATLVFFTNTFVCLRAIFDKNMLFNEIQKMGVNFNYFNDYLSFNRIMLYGLIIGNIVFMFIPTQSKKKSIIDIEEEQIAKKIEIAEEHSQKMNIEKGLNCDLDQQFDQEEGQELDEKLEQSVIHEKKKGASRHLDQEFYQEKVQKIDKELEQNLAQEEEQEKNGESAQDGKKNKKIADDRNQELNKEMEMRAEIDEELI